MTNKVVHLFMWSLLLPVLAACTPAAGVKSDPARQEPIVAHGSTQEWMQEESMPESAAVAPTTLPSGRGSEPVQSAKAPFYKVGSGKFLNLSDQGEESGSAGEITLHFDGIELHEVVRIVFEEILKQNYLIDPRVQGVVTMRTYNPVPIDSVMGILESLLQSYGAAMIYDSGLYRIIPLADAAKQSSVPVVGKVGAAGIAGFGTQIVPLRYIAAREMKKILGSVSSAELTFTTNDARNLLLIRGSRFQINQALETVKLFDVDWLKGMSFGLFALEYADAATLVDELNKLLVATDEGPLSGMVRLVPVARLNSVMVITPQPGYLDAVKELVERFDQGGMTSPGQRLYVYRLKYGKAESIAGLLQEIFGGGGGKNAPSSDQASPPAERSNVRSPTQSAITPPPQPTDKPLDPAVQMGAATMEPTSEPAPGIAGQGEVKIIADQDRNAILVLASARDYKSVEATIRKLDVPPMQVLIEATIAEVSLTNNLSYGVRWFLQGNMGGSDKWQGGLNLPLPSGVSGSGFSLGILNSMDELKLFFNLLNAQSSVKFLSAPQIMVVDNQSASFRVGDQIPIITRSSQSTTNPDAPIVTEVQFRDTGTLLTVTPRVNVGGMVTLEISQEVSKPGSAPAVGGGGNVPIAQRTVDSTVVVNSGQTIILGGLISETSNDTKDGIPILMDLPGVGKMFSNTTKDVARTELIITITPRVVANPMQAKVLTDELRKSLKEASALERSIRH